MGGSRWGWVLQIKYRGIQTNVSVSDSRGPNAHIHHLLFFSVSPSSLADIVININTRKNCQKRITHTHTHKQTRGLPGSLHLSFRLLLCPPMRASSQAISLGGAQTVGQSIGGVKRCTLWAECATLGAGLAISSRLRCSPRVSRPIDTLLSSGFLSAAESYVSRRP